MDKDLDIQIEKTLKAYLASGVEDQVDYQKFYLYSIVTHSTAIEGSTVTEIENQLLFDEGIAAKGRSLTEQMMNVDLKDAYLYAFKIASENLIYTPQLLQQLSALVMRRTGSEYSTVAGQFDSSKGEFRLCNVSAGIGGRSYLAYNKVPQSVDDFCEWLNKEIANVDKTDIAACYRLSFEAHFRLVSIHPWVDGNGRTTRLVMNMIQRQLGLVPSIVRKEDKGEHIQSLVDSRENGDSTIAQDMMLRHHISNLKRRVLQYQEGYGLMNDNVGVNVGVNNNGVGVKLTNTQRKIYELIQANQSITHSEMAKALSVTSKTAERATKALRDFGLLGREGSDKTGRWIILK
ncbi:MAG: Fic family protein [Prevotella sp.]|jgi:Fic family protein|uniref:Fic family protein n=2 Tax=Muribaculum intestinale TaxID=1796646 RepID=UPI000F4A59A6|nr:Fic family protein [Muribaculum intestinale]MCX4294438.1 Fic family protein [Prevotella sp.]ROT17630.1 winged helix-turn-helix transcriptional regulator [Muribaculaceae bacterium Isolate-110 (HZI)]